MGVSKITKMIIELQNECQKSDVDPISILRRAFVIAKKLKLDEFQKWVDSELNSYKKPGEVPSYRRIRGILYADLHYSQVPVQIPTDLIDTICTVNVSHAIPELCGMISSDSKAFRVPLQGEMNQTICELTETECQFYILMSKHQLRNIIDSVVNTILNWTLIFEENGVVGEDSTFTEDEVRKANTTYNNYMINGNVGVIQSQESCRN